MGRMKIAVIANQKGGVGKSVTAYNFGYYLSEKRGKRTLFIDFDEQASSTLTMSSIATELTASQFFGLTTIKRNDFFGELILAKSDAKLRDVESQKNNHQDVLDNLKKRLTDVSNDFDWCVIDTPGSNSIIAGASLAVADFVIVPSKIDRYSIDVATKMLKRIIGLQKSLNPKLVNIGILPTIFDTNSPAQVSDLKTLLQKYNQYILRAKISNRTSLAEAAGLGIPIWKMNKTSAREAAKELNIVFDLIAEKMGV